MSANGMARPCSDREMKYPGPSRNIRYLVAIGDEATSASDCKTIPIYECTPNGRAWIRAVSRI
jgi:hypothetical protein